MPKDPSLRVRSRGFCFTWHNYTDEVISKLKSLDTKYLVFGKELTPSNNTPHLQGYIHFKDNKTLSAVLKMLKGPQPPVSKVTPAKGTALQNQKYCTKDKDYFERGVPPQDLAAAGQQGGVAEQDRWAHITELSKAGKIDAISELYPDVFQRQYTTLKKIAADYAPRPPNLPFIAAFWVVGPSGTGKSRTVRDFFGDDNIYSKIVGARWWDQYKMEPVVHIEDIGVRHTNLSDELKIWADHYPFRMEVKGSCMCIRPRVIICSSQYTIDEIWPNEPEVKTALNRRFKSIQAPFNAEASFILPKEALWDPATKTFGAQASLPQEAPPSDNNSSSQQVHQ